MQSVVLPPIGSPLPFPNSNDVAILKYVGSVSGHDGVFCGLQLCGSLSQRGKNNGEVNGIKYFQVDIPNSGLFVPLRKVIGWLSLGNSLVNTNNSPQTVTTDTLTTISNNNTPNKPNELIHTMSFDSPNLNNNTNKANNNNNSEVTELRRHINVLEKRLVSRENDLRELDIQLDELDATLRANDARLIRKEERFNRYKAEKEDEIKLLVSTIESLGKKVEDNQVIDNSELKEKIKFLEDELKKEKENFQNFKILKNKEIDELRKIEMKNYNLEIEIEKLRESSSSSYSGNTVNDGLGKEKDVEINKLRRNIDELQINIKQKDIDLKYVNDEITELRSKLENYESKIKEKDEIIFKIQNKSIIQDEGKLKIFVPDTPVDAAAGREDFCTYCDRMGHSTEECPYEKDNIEMF